MPKYLKCHLATTDRAIEQLHRLLDDRQPELLPNNLIEILRALVNQNEKALFDGDTPYLLLAIEDTESVAEMEKLRALYPKLVKTEEVWLGDNKDFSVDVYK